MEMDARSHALSIAPLLGAARGRDDTDDELFLAVQFRLSVDSDSDSDSDTDTDTPTPPLPRALPLPAFDAVDAPLWNLISPCSDASEPPALDDLPIDQDDSELEDREHDDRPEPEASPRVVVASSGGKPVAGEEDEDDDARYAARSDSDDEEVEVFNADTAFHVDDDDDDATARSRWRRTSSINSDKPKDDALDSVTEGDECFDELDVLSSSASSSQLFVDDSASEDGCGGHNNSNASSSQASRSGRAWVGRMKARTYSGPASLQLHNAYDKLRARTRSATATLRHATSSTSSGTSGKNEDDDDGGFSSDDDDYDHERASHLPTPPTRATSLSFPTRLSAVKNLQGLQLPTKMASMMRFRSSTSSSVTTASDDSFVDSRDSTLGAGNGGDAPVPAASGLAYNRQELKHKASACATRAAGLLGAASAEAARKLRTTRAFRASSQPSMAATSPVVDREESSPGLPPLPARAMATTSTPSS